MPQQDACVLEQYLLMKDRQRVEDQLRKSAAQLRQPVETTDAALLEIVSVEIKATYLASEIAPLKRITASTLAMPSR